MIKLGLQTQQFGLPFPKLKAIWQECEKLDLDSVWLDDHLYGSHSDTFEEGYESFVTLSALSRYTRSIRIGALVTCLTFRQPSILAKMASTVDVLSGGRLEFSLGACWNDREHTSYGIPFPRAGVRISQLREAVQIVLKMWSEDKASFEGKYYSIKNAVCQPKPLQKPHPPITIGGGGRNKTLRIAAEFAERSNFGFMSPEEYKKRVDILHEHCRAVGRDPDTIEKSVAPILVVGKSLEDVKKKVDGLKPRFNPITRDGMSFEEYASKLQGGGYIVGLPNECVDTMKRYVRAGVTHFMLRSEDLWGSDDEWRRTLKIIGEEIKPQLN